MSRWTLLAAILIVGGLVTWMWQDFSPLGKQSHVLTPKSKSATYSIQPSASVTSDFEKRLQTEVSKIGNPDLDPIKTEKTLKNWAQNMSLLELVTLSEKALDLKVSQDERFLSVMLLGWSEQTAAQGMLENIALEPIDDLLTPQRLGDFERVLRMQAVESLGNLPLQKLELKSSLARIIHGSNETHIIDRAHRSDWALDGLAKSPTEQDNEALKKVLRR